jgi:hypothetical protein
MIEKSYLEYMNVDDNYKLIINSLNHVERWNKEVGEVVDKFFSLDEYQYIRKRSEEVKIMYNTEFRNNARECDKKFMRWHKYVNCVYSL